MKIAFVGVGNIGRPMAEHLRAVGHDVVVYDVRRQAAASLGSAGAAWAESPRAAATGCAIVTTCLPGPVEMERVTLGPDEILDSIAPGAVYVDHTTNAPALVRTIHDRFVAKGVAMLDAPVSGGAEGAATRDLLVMVGGEHGVFERVRPLLETVAKRVLYTGEIDCGSISKLMHNAASFTLARDVPARRLHAALRAPPCPEGSRVGARGGARRKCPHAALRPVRAGADRSDGARLGRPGRFEFPDAAGGARGSDRPRLLNEELVLPTGYAPEAIADGALDLLSKLLRVCAAPSHGLFSEGSMERLDGSPIERLLVTDSIETQPVTPSPKVEVGSVAPLFGEAIHLIHDRESVSGLCPP